MKVKSVFRKLGEDSESGILHYGTKFIIDEVLEDEEVDDDNLPDVELWLVTYISVASQSAQNDGQEKCETNWPPWVD